MSLFGSRALPPPSLDSPSMASSFHHNNSLDNSSAGSNPLHNDSLSTFGVAPGNSIQQRYYKPTMRAKQYNRALPQHTPEENVELNVIRSAFTPNSFTSFRSLPSKLNPGTISKAVLLKQESAKKPLNVPVKKWSQRSANLFSHPTYSASDYNIQSNNAKTEIKLKKAKQERICNQQFRPAAAGRRLKHESLMVPSSQDESPEPFPYSSNPLEDEQDYWRARKKEDDSRILAGHFKSAGRAKLFSDKITYLPEVVKLLFKHIKDNWEETNFQAMTTEDGMVRFQFERVTIDSEEALFNFMNVVAVTNEFVRKARLIKDDPNWGVVDDVQEQRGEWVIFQFDVAETIEPA
jgi:hypothetical protein